MRAGAGAFLLRELGCMSSHSVQENDVDNTGCHLEIKSFDMGGLDGISSLHGLGGVKFYTSFPSRSALGAAIGQDLPDRLPPDAKDVTVKSETQGLFYFSATGAHGKSFDFSLELYDNITPEGNGKDGESSDDEGLLYLPDLEKARVN
ncbi:Uncharacterized protein QJS10_CPB15g02141 [Acorus calamus]|uniref:Uncharacterized protein n=1 Tax=Acorus calamus TaxID=4465 RepID=A0AAV9D8X7_ACOCL|nr:Uncharacterized protein QJS10_CPB15g02141 [Acorus calamus]